MAVLKTETVGVFGHLLNGAVQLAERSSLISQRGLSCTQSSRRSRRRSEPLRQLHRTIPKGDRRHRRSPFQHGHFVNDGVCNHLTKLEERPKKVLETLVLLLAPYAPHVAEELLGGTRPFDHARLRILADVRPALTVADTIEVPVQVNGKLRARLTVPSGLDAAGLEAAAKADEAIQAQIAGRR